MEQLMKNNIVVNKILNYFSDEKLKGTQYDKLKTLENWLILNLILEGDVLNTNHYNNIRMIDEALDKYINIDFKIIKNIIDDSKNLEIKDISYEYKQIGMMINNQFFPVNPERLRLLFKIGIDEYQNEDHETLRKISFNISYMLLKQSQYLEAFKYPKIDNKKYRYFYARYKDDLVECVATCFTSTLLSLGGNYCSFFDETLFKSLGNFFNIDLTGKYLIVHVPFIYDILIKVAKKLIELKDKIKGFVFYIPDKQQSVKDFLDSEGVKFKKMPYNTFNFEIDGKFIPSKIDLNEYYYNM